MAAFEEFPRDADAISAENAGLALAGFLARDSAGAPMPGMLAAPKLSAVASAWKVQVGAFVYARVVNAAAYLGGISAAVQVDIVPAAGDVPTGQSRIDRIVWDPATAALSVVKGTPAASPAVPSAGGKVPVARVRVDAGDGMVIASKVTRDFAATSIGGSLEVDFGWDTAKVTVVRSTFEVTGRWARLRFYVKRRSGQWVNGDRLGQLSAALLDLAPKEIEFAPVSVTPVGPVGNIAMRPTGQLDLYTTSGSDVLGDIEWPLW